MSKIQIVNNRVYIDGVPIKHVKSATLNLSVACPPELHLTVLCEDAFISVDKADVHIEEEEVVE